MYKHKIIAWVVAIAILFAVNTLTPIVKKNFAKETIEVKFTGKEINVLSQYFSDTKMNGYKIRIDDVSPHIIFSQKNEDIENYSKYNNSLYSILCLYLDSAFIDLNDGLTSVKGNDNAPYIVDLKLILTSMEEKKTWEQLGFDSRVLSGDVNLYIAESGLIYDKTEELFYLALNDGITVDETRKEELKPRVDAILSKCIKVSNLQQLIEDRYNNPGDERIAIIAPEYYFYLLGNCTGTSNYHSFAHVYFYDSVYLKTYIYIADSAKENVSVNTFLDKMADKSDLFYAIGWRTYSGEFNPNHISNMFLASP